MKIILLDEIDSTNDYIKIQCEQGLNESMLVLAKQQTMGKGRQGKQFKSPTGGLYMSYAFTTEQSIEESVYYSFISSVAVIKALKSLYGIQAQIKWINDIYYDEKKLGGILCQSGYNLNHQRYIIVGIGINVLPVSGIDQEVISLSQISDHIYDLPQLATQIVDYIQNHNNQWKEIYDNHLLYKNQFIQFFNDKRNGVGILKGINDMGALLIDVEGKQIIIDQSDVSIRKI